MHFCIGLLRLFTFHRALEVVELGAGHALDIEGPERVDTQRAVAFDELILLLLVFLIFTLRSSLTLITTCTVFAFTPEMLLVLAGEFTVFIRER